MKLIIFVSAFLLFLGCHQRIFDKPNCVKIFTPMFYYSSLSSSDTVFTYKVGFLPSNTPYRFIAPDSLGGSRVEGYIVFFAYLDKNRQLKYIELNTIDLSKNGKSWINYEVNCYGYKKDLDYIAKIKNFLNHVVPTFRVHTLTGPVQDLTKTYCVVYLGSSPPLESIENLKKRNE